MERERDRETERDRERLERRGRRAEKPLRKWP